MANFAFYNIGLANKEITRLAARIAELESAKPVDQSASLAEAIASNDQISAELTKVKSDFEAKAVAFDQLTKTNAQLHTELSQACLASKLEVSKEATGSTMLAALVAATNTAVAKTGIVVASLPAASGVPSDSNEAAKKMISDMSAMDSGEARVEFYRKNKAAIDNYYNS
jgi:hypothetical protein